MYQEENKFKTLNKARNYGKEQKAQQMEQPATQTGESAGTAAENGSTKSGA
jgi:hypothetical protein